MNERRARYASALLDAAEFKLNNWPRLDLGLSYDQAVTWFDNMPAVLAGDAVTKQILRVFAGLSQPLLDFRENNARTESALSDAALANNLLDKEIDDRTTEAAAHTTHVQPAEPQPRSPHKTPSRQTAPHAPHSGSARQESTPDNFGAGIF